MKYILAAVFITFVPASEANALSWDGVVSKPIRSIKSLFTNSAVREPSSLPVPGENVNLQLNLPPADAKAYLEKAKPVLIDIRTPEEYAAGHLENSVLTDYYAPDFKDKLNLLDKSAKYLIYCRSGKRSAAALKIMQELGFKDIHDIAGGINAWIAAGFSVVK